MQNEMFDSPDEWDEEEPYYDWDDPDWREETDWSDLFGSDVQRAEVVESRDCAEGNASVTSCAPPVW